MNQSQAEMTKGDEERMGVWAEDMVTSLSGGSSADRIELMRPVLKTAMQNAYVRGYQAAMKVREPQAPEEVLTEAELKRDREALAKARAADPVPVPVRVGESVGVHEDASLEDGKKSRKK